MIEELRTGKEVTILGERYIVINFKEEAFSDMGCGPVIDLYKVTIKNVENGKTVEIKWES